MKAQIKIERVSASGSSMVINAETDNVKELEDIIKSCRSYAPRARIFGII